MKHFTPLILLCYINLFGQINLIPNSSFETGLGVPYCSNPLEKDTTKINECNFGIQISHHFSTSEIKNALKIGLSLAGNCMRVVLLVLNCNGWLLVVPKKDVELPFVLPSTFHQF